MSSRGRKLAIAWGALAVSLSAQLWVERALAQPAQPKPAAPAGPPAPPDELPPELEAPPPEPAPLVPPAPPPTTPPPAPPPGPYPPPPPGYPPYPYPPYPPYGYLPPGYYPYPPPGLYPYGGYQPPATLPYEEGKPPPPGYELDTRIHRGLVIAGATTFGTLALVSTAVGAAFQEGSEGDAHAPLFAPLLGPFIALGTIDASSLGTFMLVLDGAGQAAGVAMLIVGLMADEPIWVRSRQTPFGLRPTFVPAGMPGLGMELTL